MSAIAARLAAPGMPLLGLSERARRRIGALGLLGLGMNHVAGNNLQLIS